MYDKVLYWLTKTFEIVEYTNKKHPYPTFKCAGGFQRSVFAYSMRTPFVFYASFALKSISSRYVTFSY